MMIYDTLTPYEKTLVMTGFDTMSGDYQNALMNAISRKSGKLLWQIKPEDTLNYHKDIKLAMQNEFYEIEVAAGFTAPNGHKYRSNADDQTNFIGKMVYLLMNPDIAEINWKAEDVDDYIVHPKDEWIQVALAGFTHKEATLAKFHEKTKAIKTATTHEQVLAVSWSNTTPNK
ncbi:hypothetical protein BigBertha_95 [Bacillus phage BigBertha]|uniref:DUF4376 domain-containing protein n=1 Tax=Bacillus phage BigBertha TaxID=1406781 RepID=U5PVY6_9CAUD|nr:tail fiber protein [Bacillus phage BigBertha]AGY46603.1 hypothetical protein BigBertha_95 [Bacillus phage BigBertha]